MKSEMTPDELVAAIFKAQNKLRPDEDPGDLTITVQDDMPLVEVHNAGLEKDQEEAFGIFTHCFGDSIQYALENALDIYESEVS